MPKALHSIHFAKYKSAFKDKHLLLDYGNNITYPAQELLQVCRLFDQTLFPSYPVSGYIPASDN